MIPPETIAHYKLSAKLGEGGMGAVYRATDTKLNREVAIKVLPDAFAQDAARMARFEREAQVLASLNHPNIAAIYGIEQAAIVMELVEGADLKGPVSIDTAIDYARQMAAGLEAAHEKGIVHRDLKPANIKVTPDGTVKLLDFGLAKTTDDAPQTAATMSPTLSLAMTQAGIILGTAAYMSPEQARGKSVDKRADIWAFGVVLFELLTGKQLFAGGDTVTDIIAAVVTREPDWDALPKDTPPHVRRLLERCLRKDPKQRLRDIGDARLALDEGNAGDLVAGAPPTPRRTWGWVAAGILAAALAAAMLIPRPAPTPVLRPLLRFEADLAPESGGELALSPDGSRVVYSVPKGTNTQLVTRLLDQAEAVPVPETENGFRPAISSNGEWIVFGSSNQLRKVPVRGGPAITLSNLGSGLGTAWGDDGSIVFAPTIRSLIYRIPAAGGAAKPVTKMDESRKEVTHRLPWLLPGGQVMLFVASNRGGAYDEADIVAQNLNTGQRRVLHHGGFFPRYLPGPDGKGYLLYVQGSTVFAMSLDPAKLEVREPPVPVLQGVSSDPGSAFAQFAVATTGLVVYRPGTNQDANTVQWIDAAGNAAVIHEGVGDYQSPRLSPDGKRVVYALRNSAGYDLWVCEVPGGAPSRLTFTGHAQSPAWSPDGRHLAFIGSGKLFWLRSDGSGQPRALVDITGAAERFTPDGRRLLIGSNRPETRGDIFALPFDASDSDDPHVGPLETILATPANEEFADLSPDGKWLTYASDETGTREVYVRSFPNLSGKWQISQGGGSFPNWSPKGGELFYRALHSTMSVSYSGAGEAFTHGAPRAWSTQSVYSRGMRNYSMAPDGIHMAAVLPPPANQSAAPTRLVFLVNFYDEVQRKIAQAVR